jgi:hypothetical protein
MQAPHCDYDLSQITKCSNAHPQSPSSHARAALSNGRTAAGGVGGHRHGAYGMGGGRGRGMKTETTNMGGGDVYACITLTNTIVINQMTSPIVVLGRIGS